MTPPEASTGWAVHKVLFVVTLGVTMAGLVAFSVSSYMMVREIVDRAAQDGLQGTANLFADSISNDVLMGRNSEIYRKCRLLIQSKAVDSVEVLDPTREDLCLSGATARSKGSEGLVASTAIFFDESKKELAATVFTSHGDHAARRILDRTLTLLAATTIALIIILGAPVRALSQALARPIQRLTAALESADLAVITSVSAQGAREWIREVGALYRTTGLMAGRLQVLQAERVEASKMEAMARLATQVAHDIRSPLAALKSSLGRLEGIPPAQRTIVRSALERIAGIANDLLQHQQAQPLRPQRLLHLVTSILDEKREQFSSRPGLSISGPATADGHVFARVSVAEFKRAISNLVNNAVESLSGEGRVVVGLRSAGDILELTVNDTGAGIPSDVLARLGQRGATHGKRGGSGLGLHHAKSCVEGWGGRLEITSQIGVGTTVRISLPRSEPPPWDVPAVLIRRGQTVVLADDDPTIIELWKGRLNALPLPPQVLSAATPPQLRALQIPTDALFLIDLEFDGFADSGLSLTREFTAESRAILVTGRHDDSWVQEECAARGIRLLPKEEAATIPLHIIEETGPTAAVLIDDDPLVRMNWTVAAKRAGKALKAYPDAASFIKEAGDCARDTPIYIDSDLGEGMKGEDAAKELLALGFTELRLATGHDPASFPPLPHIKAIQGKEPPWASA